MQTAGAVSKLLVVKLRPSESASEESRPKSSEEPPRAQHEQSRCDIACSECAGWYELDVPVGHPQFGKLVLCENRRSETALERAEQLQKICGLNDTERLYRLDDVAKTGGVTDRVIEAARAFVGNPSGFLTIHGGVGNGKTLIVMAIVNELVLLGIPAMYTTLYDLEGWVRQAYQKERVGKASGNEEDVYAALTDWQRVNRLAGLRVLAIDEFDKVKVSDWTYQIETAIIDARYRSGMAGLSGTLLAMNRFDLPAHIESRVRDKRFVLIENTDSDMRIAR